MSSSQPPADVTTPPKYENVSTSSISSSLILTGVFILEFNLITLVLLLVIFRPTGLALSCNFGSLVVYLDVLRIVMLSQQQSLDLSISS